VTNVSWRVVVASWRTAMAMFLLLGALWPAAVQDARLRTATTQAATLLPATLTRAPGRLILANGYVRVEFNLSHPQIDIVRADFSGAGNYGRNLLAVGRDPAGLTRGGIVLERDDAIMESVSAITGATGPGAVATTAALSVQALAHASSQGVAAPPRIIVLAETPSLVRVRIDGITDDPIMPLVTSDWTVSLAAGARAFTLDVAAHALRDADNVAGVRLSSYLAPFSTYGFFARGVEQMMNSRAPFFASDSPLRRFYALGGGGSVDLTATGSARETVLMSARPGSAVRGGIQQVLAGHYPHHDTWIRAGWGDAAPTRVTAGETWAVSDTIAVNNADFPVGNLPPGSNLPADDLRALYTAIYASSAGALVTYSLPGETATTLATPWRDYPHGHNFYDPDTWMAVSALVYSGDPYLQRQARTIIDKTGAHILSNGQVPHHFVDTTPSYVAISGATMTGPNIFWIASALQYARATGDYDWLRARMPLLERALGYLTDRYDPRVGLVDAPGPLWIDVFIRDHYASDTNAYMVEILREMADAERFLAANDGHAGNSAGVELAAGHEAMARSIAAAMNARLWAGDHYITQMNPDGSVRDFVDYDSNLLAVAFGIAPPARAALIMRRIDGGGCGPAPVAAGYVSTVNAAGLLDASGVYYGPGDTYNRNLGDSSLAMGRIAWADGRASARVGDVAAFDDRVLDPVRTALLARTWLNERYTCGGVAVRARYYHEYPEMVAMLLREVRYGVNIGLRTVDISPLGPTRYHYHIGNVDVDYSPTVVTFTVPGSGDKRVSIAHLIPNALYSVRATDVGDRRVREARAATDGRGTVTFTAPIGLQWQVRAMFVRRLPPPIPPAGIDLTPYVNDAGISDDNDTYPAAFDRAGDSYSLQALATSANGQRLTPGARFSRHSIALAWPDASGAHANNVIARGQTISLTTPLSGTALGVVGASVGGAAMGTGVITYTNGMSQCFSLPLGDWVGAAAPGDEVIARQTYRNNRDVGSSQKPATRLYYTAIRLKRGKRVAALRLPVLPRPARGERGATRVRVEEHIFALSIGRSSSPAPAASCAVATATPSATPTATPSATPRTSATPTPLSTPPPTPTAPPSSTPLTPLVIPTPVSVSSPTTTVTPTSVSVSSPTTAPSSQPVATSTSAATVAVAKGPAAVAKVSTARVDARLPLARVVTPIPGPAPTPNVTPTPVPLAIPKPTTRASGSVA